MRKLVLVVLGAAASLALVACGSSSDTSSTTAASSTTSTTDQAGGGGGGGTVSLAADPNGALAYQQKSLTAKAGKATIDFDNPAAIGHDVCVQDSSGKEVGCSDIIEQSKTTLDVDLKPGDYTFFCSVDGHEAAGMKGTLTVN